MKQEAVKQKEPVQDNESQPNQWTEIGAQDLGKDSDIIAVLPVYHEDSNHTLCWQTDNRQAYYIKRTRRHTINTLLSRRGKHLRCIPRKPSDPIPVSPYLVLIPFIMRKPVQTYGHTETDIGYLNLYHIARVIKGSMHWTYVITDTNQIFIVYTAYSHVLKRMEQARDYLDTYEPHLLDLAETKEGTRELALLEERKTIISKLKQK